MFSQDLLVFYKILHQYFPGHCSSFGGEGESGRAPHGLCDLSSLTRDGTWAPSVEGQSLNHWTAKEVPLGHLLTAEPFVFKWDFTETSTSQNMKAELLLYWERESYPIAWLPQSSVLGHHLSSFLSVHAQHTYPCVPRLHHHHSACLIWFIHFNCCGYN